MTSPIDIGPLLIETRIARGISQRQLADLVSVKQPQIARWEVSKYRTATLSKVDEVARALDLDIAVAPPLAAESSALYSVDSPTSRTAIRALARLGVLPDTIESFCRLHGVAEFALFGSSVRSDFSADSDVDVLVRWKTGKKPRSFGKLSDIETELRGIFRRPIDLVDREALEQSENWVRRQYILDGARTVYVAR